MRLLFPILAASIFAPTTSASVQPSPPGPAAGGAVADSAAAVRWNVLARRLWKDAAARFGAAQARAARGDPAAALAARTLTPPPFPLRYLTVLGAAQYAAAAATPPRGRAAAVADASAAALGALLPDSVSRAAVAAAHARDLHARRLHARDARARDPRAGEPTRSGAPARTPGASPAGVRAAARVLAWAAADRHDARWTGTVPTGPGMWRSAPGEEPVLAAAPRWRPWALDRASQVRPTAPPAYGSPAFEAALAEVRQVARTRTPEQTRIARRWDAASPLDAWNRPAMDALVRARAGELEAARTAALLNVAMFDAFVACWEAKYHYWLLRPSQADSTIRLAEGVDLPNWPSYPAGHACVAGAAAEALGALAPAARAAADRMAAEGAVSRLHAGVHYRFDNDTGLALGRRVARHVLAADARGRLGAAAPWRAGADAQAPALPTP